MIHGAITGNLGSGKTTVCKIFEVLDIPTYYSDARAKLLMKEDKNLVSDIKSLLGDDAYDGDGILDRSFVSKKIFTNRDLLNQLNALVHPAVGRDYLLWREKQNSPFTLQESALTFEISADKRVDFTILVYAPEELLISRGMARDGKSQEEIKARLANQMDQEEKLKRADYVIYNAKGDSLIKQVLEMYRKIILR